MTLTPIDATNEIAVTSYLQQARDWLSRAVDETGPEQIAAAKAEIATAAEATKQLGLSKEIQLDAQEMVRRAEYALGKAVRRGQAEGTIATREDNLARSPFRRGTTATRPSSKPSSTDFFGSKEERGDVYALVDSGGFEEAIEEARLEGNLSRANVARKAREKSGAPRPAVAGTTERGHQEAELINAFGSIVKRSLTPENVATLSPRAKNRLIEILTFALTTLKENDQ